MHCWQTLEIAPTPDKGEIRRAYARLIKCYRPESHPTEFASIRQAYEVALAESVYLVEDETSNAPDAPDTDDSTESTADTDTSTPSVLTLTPLLPLAPTPVALELPPLHFPAADAAVDSAGDTAGNATNTPEAAPEAVPCTTDPLPEFTTEANEPFDVANALHTLLALNRAGDIPTLLATFEQQQQQLKNATLDEGITYESELLYYFYWAESPALEWVFAAASRFGWRDQGIRLQMAYGDSLAERMTRLMALADDYARHVHFSLNPWIARRVGVPSLMLSGTTASPPCCASRLMQLPLRRWRDEAIARVQGWHRLCDNTYPELDYAWKYGLPPSWNAPYRLISLFALLLPLLNASFAAYWTLVICTSEQSGQNSNSLTSMIAALLVFAAVFTCRFKTESWMQTMQQSRYWRWVLRLPSPPIGQWFAFDLLLGLSLCALLDSITPQRGDWVVTAFVLVALFWISVLLTGILFWLGDALLARLQAALSWLKEGELQLAYEHALTDGKLLAATLPRTTWAWASLRQTWRARKRWLATQPQPEKTSWGWFWKGWLILMVVRALVTMLGKG
jgi:hypothetical protein